MEMMRKALEYCQSPIYGVERALERERSSDRERISERERHGSRREWSPTQEIPVLALCTRWDGSTLTRANGGYGFTSTRWRQQGCCQTVTVRKHQFSRKKTFISAGCSNQRNMSLFSTPLEGRICRALWKMTSGDDNLQTKGENERPIREITENGHYGKSKWRKWTGGPERRRDGPAAVWGCRAETRLLATDDVLYACQFSTSTKMLFPAPEDRLMTIKVFLRATTFLESYHGSQTWLETFSQTLTEEKPHRSRHTVPLQVKAGVPTVELTA